MQVKDLANLRYPSLLVTSATTATLLGRCSRGTLTRLRLRSGDSKKAPWIIRQPGPVPVNLTGRVRHLVPTFCGEAMLALGDNGRIQSWELGEDEVVTESFVSDPGIKSASRIATWHDGELAGGPHARSWLTQLLTQVEWSPLRRQTD